MILNILPNKSNQFMQVKVAYNIVQKLNHIPDFFINFEFEELLIIS